MAGPVLLSGGSDFSPEGSALIKVIFRLARKAQPRMVVVPVAVHPVAAQGQPGLEGIEVAEIPGPHPTAEQRRAAHRRAVGMGLPVEMHAGERGPEDQQQVAREHEADHRADEEQHVGVVAAQLSLAAHVVDREDDREAADDGGDDGVTSGNYKARVVSVSFENGVVGRAQTSLKKMKEVERIAKIVVPILCVRRPISIAWPKALRSGTGP